MLGTDGVNSEPKIDVERSANGLSVRCFKNETNTWSSSIDVASINMDWWVNAIISIASWVVKTIKNPTRWTDVFWWWYTNEDYSWNSIQIGDTIEKWSSLYAKWECSDWYVDDWDECVEWFKIKFDARENWWTTNVEPIIVTGSSVSTWLNLSDYETYIAEKEWYYFVWWNTDKGATRWLSWIQTFTKNTTQYLLN